MIIYETPNHMDENRVYIISEERAIQIQRSKGMALGHEYKSDEEALQDYLVVNWAWQVDSLKIDGEIVK